MPLHPLESNITMPLHPLESNTTMPLHPIESNITTPLHPLESNTTMSLHHLKSNTTMSLHHLEPNTTAPLRFFWYHSGFSASICRWTNKIDPITAMSFMKLSVTLTLSCRLMLAPDEHRYSMMLVCPYRAATCRAVSPDYNTHCNPLCRLSSHTLQPLMQAVFSHITTPYVDHLLTHYNPVCRPSCHTLQPHM